MVVMVLAFIVNKFYLRPFVLDNHYGNPWESFVLSMPNMCEAIVGPLFLSNVALVLVDKNIIRPKYKLIFSAVLLLSAVYVILQELKIHNLGGRRATPCE